MGLLLNAIKASSHVCSTTHPVAFPNFLNQTRGPFALERRGRENFTSKTARFFPGVSFDCETNASIPTPVTTATYAPAVMTWGVN